VTAVKTEHLGPATDGTGSLDRQTTPPGMFSRIPGEKVKATPMTPAEVPLSKPMRERLIQYLDEELAIAEGERWQWVSKLARLKRKYRAPFPTTPKDFPVANSSQITIPIIKTAVDTLAARIQQTIMAAEPLASMRTEDNTEPLLADLVFQYERFMDVFSKEKLNIEEILDTHTTEVIKLGTSILEVTTLLDRRAMVMWDPEQRKYEKKAKTMYSGPILYNVPIEDFWMRVTHQDPQTAPWCGKEIRLTWSQIKDMALAGDLNPKHIDNLWKARREDTVPETVTKTETDEEIKPAGRDQFRIFELSVRWDVDGDGYDEELLLYYERRSRTLLRVKFNGFRNARRPWIVNRFKKIEHWFYGEGLAETLEHLQEEISTIHNQRLDSASIANMRLILVRAAIKGLRPGDRVWPGKIVKVPTSVKDDVGTLQLGDVPPSSFNNEQMALQYVERASAVGDSIAGTAQPVSRTTATAQLALLEEANRRFYKVVANTRRTTRQVYEHISDLFIQHGTGGLAELYLGQKFGPMLDQFLLLPHDYLARLFKIQIKSTKTTVNREVEFTTQIQVFNLSISLWQQIRAEAAQLNPEILPVLAHEFVKTIRPIFKKIMQYADADDPDQAVAVLSVLEQILPAAEGMGGMGGQGEGQDAAGIQELLNGLRGADQGVVGGGGNGAASPQTVQGVGDPFSGA
jgi:hypothetical protein